MDDGGRFVSKAVVPRGFLLGRVLLGAFLFFAPFTTWLAVSTWLRLPVVLIMTSVGVCLPFIIRAFFLKPLRFIDEREDLLLYCFICIAAVSWALGYGEVRSRNHLFALSFTFIFYFGLFKWMARDNRITSRKIARIIAYSALCCCTIVILEFLLLNLFGFQIRHFFVTGGSATSNMDFFVRGLFKSGAGTAEEPGSMGMFLNIFCPIGMWYFYEVGRRKLFTMLLVMYPISLLLLTSIAAILIGFGLAITIALSRATLFFWTVKRVAIPGLLLCLILGYKYQNNIAPLFGGVTRDLVKKIALSQESTSASVRTMTWKKARENWEESPIFGKGPGYGVQSLGWGYHSVFFTVLADLGIINLLLFCAFLGVILAKLFVFPATTRLFFIIPILGTLIHFNIIGDYFHAPFWIAVALVQFIHSESRQGNKEIAS